MNNLVDLYEIKTPDLLLNNHIKNTFYNPFDKRLYLSTCNDDQNSKNMLYILNSNPKVTSVEI